jgi:hypothetical protein
MTAAAVELPGETTGTAPNGVERYNEMVAAVAFAAGVVPVVRVTT